MWVWPGFFFVCRVVTKLPDPNIQLLKHLMVLLYHISDNADTNKMDSNNLAVCISPNLLQAEVEKMQEVSRSRFSTVTSESRDLQNFSHFVAESQKKQAE